MCVPDALQAEEEERRAKEAEERLEREERERAAKRPRHHVLDLATLGDDMSTGELAALISTIQSCARERPARSDEMGPDLDDTDKEEPQVAELREQLGKLKVVSRAKVTQDRVYSALYHPEQVRSRPFYDGYDSD